jgi:histidinol dehydrogenase
MNLGRFSPWRKLPERKKVSKTLIRVWKSSAPARRWMEKRKKGKVGNKKLETYVRSIIREVKWKRGAALIEFTKKFDNVDLSPKNLRVTQDEIKRAYGMVSEEQISALKFMKGRVENLEKRLLEQVTVKLKDDGVEVYGSPLPIQSVGCYVPGGEAAYPSTLIMTVVPAKVAGVPRVVVCTPPMGNGQVNSLTLVAADLCKVDEVYRVGGAQAIAALAYGTETLKPVRKIVGPGNRYVTMAKLLVSFDVAIDMPAGPSEILVLADGTADARIIALDMISQAEHSIDSISGLITTSKRLAEGVTAELRKRVSAIPRSGIVAEALQRNGFIILCRTMDETIELANTFAPEHLEIITENPRGVADKVTSAGLVLMGPLTPVAASDYCLGTNHVLPTGGFGHTYSGLSVLDFIRRVNFVECFPEGLQRLRYNVRVLTETENLPNHFLAVEGRFKIE